MTSTMKLHILKPSVNNLAVRVFVRAAGLDVTEIDAWGQTRSEGFMAKCPAHLTPMLECDELPNGAIWESSAIMQYLANRHKLTTFYPVKPEKRAMIDCALFYITGTIYPLVARATYPALGFPQYPGEVGASNANNKAKEEARKAANIALMEPLQAFREFYLDKRRFVGGPHPTIADIRLVTSLEFLAAVDYNKVKPWARTYMERLEEKLGAAYSEPAADVRDYISHIRLHGV